MVLGRWEFDGGFAARAGEFDGGVEEIGGMGVVGLVGWNKSAKAVEGGGDGEIVAIGGGLEEGRVLGGE